MRVLNATKQGDIRQEELEGERSRKEGRDTTLAN
jgi:hypothetical protein